MRAPVQAPLLTRSRVGVLALVEERPGVSTRGVARALGVDDSTADYHLRMLHAAGRVARVRWGRVLAHFPNGFDESSRLRRLLAEDQRAVLAALEEAGHALRAVDLARRTGFRVGSARWAMRLAVRAGLARRVGLGRFEAVGA